MQYMKMYTYVYVHIPRFLYYGKLLFSLRIPVLGSGSDFEAFIVQTGVPSANLRYRSRPSLGLSSYPLYHSAYESFYLVDQHMDPGFRVSTHAG